MLAPSPCMSRGKLSVAARTGNYTGKRSGHLTPTIDYRAAGAADGQLPVSVERAAQAVIITVDFGEEGRQRNREPTSLLIGFLTVWVIGGIYLASDLNVSGKEWVGFGAIFGGGAALPLWGIVAKRRELKADRWWRLTASSAGLLIERQNRNGAAYSRQNYLRDRIRDVTVERTDSDAGDHCQVCIYAPHPHREPVRHFNLRHREAEMIVNAIREGLRL